jgi:hypothetical protein
MADGDDSGDAGPRRGGLLNDSAELRDAIRSIEAIREDERAVDPGRDPVAHHPRVTESVTNSGTASGTKGEAE